MKKHYAFFIKCALSVCVLILASGCSNLMRLQYVKPPINDMNMGKVYVIVQDQRLPDRGGDDPTRVGTIRNNFGMPFPLKSRADREPSIVVKELVSDCLRAAGYEISRQPENVPQLHVVLKAFWSDGYQHSRIGTTIPVELKRDEHSQPVWQHIFNTNIGVTWKVGYGPFDRGINIMLEEVKNNMIREFENPEFKRSLKSL